MGKEAAERTVETKCYRKRWGKEGKLRTSGCAQARFNFAEELSKSRWSYLLTDYRNKKSASISTIGYAGLSHPFTVTITAP